MFSAGMNSSSIEVFGKEPGLFFALRMAAIAAVYMSAAATKTPPKPTAIAAIIDTTLPRTDAHPFAAQHRQPRSTCSEQQQQVWLRNDVDQNSRDVIQVLSTGGHDRRAGGRDDLEHA